MKKNLLIPALLFLFMLSCEDKETVVSNFTVSKNIYDEGNVTQSQTVTVTIVGEINSAVLAHYNLVAGTAKEGVDYNASEGVLEFSEGNKQATLSFDIIGDNNLELREELALMLEYQGSQFFVPIQIADDDIIEPILSDADGYYTPETYPSMNRVWNDEFSDATLNTSTWSYELGNGCNVSLCGWGNNELEIYTDKPENIKLESGRLVITARKEAGGSYTSARIKTENKKELKFGRIDVRAKLPKGQGIWPAIWMLGENIDVVSWPTCGEIDIMELVGHEPATVYGTVHYNNDGYKYNSSSKSLTSGDFSDKFHVFSIVWDFNSIIWYVDNIEFKRFSNSGIASWPFNKPFYFIMNVAVGGNWPGPPDATTSFPQQMEVDYIRVFQ